MLEPILGRGEEIRDRLQMMSPRRPSAGAHLHHCDYHLVQTGCRE